MQIQFTTAREYDGAQTITVTVESITPFDGFYGYSDVVATFSDSSRYIAGRVDCPMMRDGFNAKELQDSVMFSYDRGLYTAETFVRKNNA